MFHRSDCVRVHVRGPYRVVVAAAAMLVLSASADGADWPQHLGPTRNGVYAGDDIAAAWPPSGPPVVWRKQVGEGFSGPVVASGRLILFHRVGDRETVDCFDAVTGEPHWSFAYPTAYKDDFGFDAGPRGTPAVAGGRVYTFGAQGVLHCLDLETGRKLWSVDTRARFAPTKGYFGAACSPLVDGDRVLLNIGGAKAGIGAFDARTGEVLWTATDHQAGYASPTVATIAGARHAFFFTRAGLVDADPATGRVRFTFPWRARIGASVNAATPLVIGDRVFLSSSYRVGAVLLRIQGDRAEKRWSFDDVLSNHYATSVHHKGFLYGFDGRQEHGPNLRCVALDTGKVRWSRDRVPAGTITVAGEHLLVLDEKGVLTRAPATPEGFKPGARITLLPPTVRAYPAWADGRLYVRNETTLVCVDLRAAR